MYRLLLLLILHSCVFAAEESFLLVNGKTGDVLCALGDDVDTRWSPCSSFKIMLSLIGYDAGVLEDTKSPVWEFQEGYDDFLPSWKTPQSPLSWMKCSCVWYSKVLASQLGRETMDSYLASFDYGNCDLSGGFAAPAWIDSSLQISPREQVAFLRRMLSGKLPVSQYAIEMTKTLVFQDELAGGLRLYGKTGWCGSAKDMEYSWFVGWVEKGELFFPFAYFIRDTKIQLAQRIPRAKQFIQALDL